MKFRAAILLAGKTATGIEVPREVTVPPETRQRRIAKAIAMLGEGRKR